MSGKQCARCGKVVYPIEELKCLDKTWHKQCFKCQVCQMTLNMRNYKGFNKEPYCEAHIPKAKATTVAMTPEYRRIAENTKIQSNVNYHADFEKAKGKCTQVADDPETLRIKENSKNISNVAYHGELQKKADMERQRTTNDEAAGRTYAESANGGFTQPQAPRTYSGHQLLEQAPPYEPPQPRIHHARQSSNIIYTSNFGPVNDHEARHVGSISDLDPVNHYYGSLANPKQNETRPPYQPPPQRYYPPPGEPIQLPPIVRSYLQTKSQGPAPQGYGASGYQDGYGPQLHTNTTPLPQPPRNSGRVFKAMYDYTSADADEVSFKEGDLIFECVAIDEGWMLGMVKRTGQKGMLPANYVMPAI